MGDILPGVTPSGTSGDEVAVAVYCETAESGVAVFPQQVGGRLATAASYMTGYRYGTGSLIVGDVDADGRDDVVFRHTLGTLYAWLMAGAEIVEHGSLGSIGTGWSNVGLLDLDGDNNRDLIWRRNDGRVRVGFLDGISSMSTESITTLNDNWVFVNPR